MSDTTDIDNNSAPTAEDDQPVITSLVDQPHEDVDSPITNSSPEKAGDNHQSQLPGSGGNGQSTSTPSTYHRRTC